MEKSPKGKCTCRDSNLRHRFAKQTEIMRTIHHGTYTCPSGIFPFVYIMTPFFLRVNNFSCLAAWIWCLNRLNGCLPGAGKNVSENTDLVCQVYV